MVNLVKFCFKFHRSLDVSLDNEIERIHAQKLVRRITRVVSHKLPKSLVFPIVAIGSDGAEERDRMVRVSLATICEMCKYCINPKNSDTGNNCYNYSPGIYSEGYIVFVFLSVRTYRPVPLCRLRLSRYYHLCRSDFSFPTFFFHISLHSGSGSG